jgi:hypothetical protein
MTRQARSCAVIMGFDKHMILETVPVHLQHARTRIRPSTGHRATMLRPCLRTTPGNPTAGRQIDRRTQNHHACRYDACPRWTGPSTCWYLYDACGRSPTGAEHSRPAPFSVSFPPQNGSPVPGDRWISYTRYGAAAASAAEEGPANPMEPGVQGGAARCGRRRSDS